MLVYDHTFLAEPNLLIPGKKPVGPVKIIKDHWSMRDNKLLWLFNEGGGAAKNRGLYQTYDLQMAPVNGAGWSVNDGVTGKVGTGDTEAFRNSTAVSLPTIFSNDSGLLRNMSFLSRFKMDTVPTDDRGCFFSGASAGNNCLLFGYNNSVTKFGIAFGHWETNFVGETIAAANMPTGWVTAIATYNKTATNAVAIYLSWTRNKTTGTTNTYDGTIYTSFDIGQVFNNATYGQGFDGHFGLTRIWDRVLTDAEAWSLIDDPYQFLEPA